VRLPADHVPPAPPRHKSLGRMHSIATAGMALSAAVGILAMLAFVTVGWPGRSGRYVVVAAVVAALVFVTSASIAVFAAARHTYAQPGAETKPEADE
jgi:hypothetical protein